MMINEKVIVSAGAFFLIVLLENLWPFYRRDRRRWRHDGRNILLFVFNVVVLSLLFSGVNTMVFFNVAAHQWGLGNHLGWNDPWRMLITFVLFDFWMYLWHVMNHRIPFLWRFHRMHHSDPALDASSALRFHTGELFFSQILRLIIVVVLGMRLVDLVVYESVMMPVIILHHSNFRLPAPLDAALRWIIITPRVHWVHHSVIWEETNSNFGTVFSWWDRLWRTFRLRRDPQRIVFGLQNMQAEEWQTFPGMLKTPFVFVPADPGMPSSRNS